MITVRPPIALDASDMARLLNEIIVQGGTTARTTPVTAADIRDLIASHPGRSAWQVALDAQEKVVGFQWVAPEDYLPPNAVDISTFVQVGQTGLGIGSALFAATKKAAKDLGYTWINANIRADNEGGLIYYQSRGFQDYDTIENYALADGTLVTKRLKRFDL